MTHLRPRNLTPVGVAGGEDPGGLVLADGVQAAPLGIPAHVHHRPVVAPQRMLRRPPSPALACAPSKLHVKP